MAKSFLRSMRSLLPFLATFNFYYCNEPEVKRVDQPANFTEVFELFWAEMNTNYVYWDLDSTNWDKTYTAYRNIFAKLDLNNPSDVEKSVEYFKEITQGLIDGHFNINFLHSNISDMTINPLRERKLKQGKFHYPYSYLPYDTVYLDPGYKIGYDYQNSTLGRPLICVSGTINNDLAYFSCNYFALARSYLNNPTGDVRKTLDYFFDLVSNTTSNVKGIIIDVRANPGGDLVDLNFFIGRLINEPLLIGYTQYKRHQGRLNFTPWVKAYVNPQPGSRKNELPIVVLADNYSASLSETFVLALKSMPNSIFLGESTYGATGPLVPNKVYESGSFEIKNFMEVQASSCKFKYLDDKIYEGIGVKPDIHIPYSHEAYENGIDLHLQNAIELLK